LGIIIPTDELIFFRGVETTNQMSNRGFTNEVWKSEGLTCNHEEMLGILHVDKCI